MADKVLAIDIDAVWTGRRCRHPSVISGIKTLVRGGHGLCWLTNDTVRYVRHAEREMGFKVSSIVLDPRLRDILTSRELTLYRNGQVQVTIGTLSVKQADPWLRRLPCSPINYVKFTGLESVEFLIPPDRRKRDGASQSRYGGES